MLTWGKRETFEIETPNKHLAAVLKSLLNKKCVCKTIPQPVTVQCVRKDGGKGRQEEEEQEQLWLYYRFSDRVQSTPHKTPLSPCSVLCSAACLKPHLKFCSKICSYWPCSLLKLVHRLNHLRGEDRCRSTPVKAAT